MSVGGGRGGQRLETSLSVPISVTTQTERDRTHPPGSWGRTRGGWVGCTS